MIKINTLIKVSVAVLLMGAIFSTAQAGDQLNIEAKILASIKVDVTAVDALKDLNLNPLNKYYQTTAASAVKVTSNKATWTLQAQASPAQLTSGAVHLLNNFYLDTTGNIPSGTGYNWTSSITPGDLWKDGGNKGPKTANLKFTQPVDWNDDILTGYATVVTFTAAVTGS